MPLGTQVILIRQLVSVCTANTPDSDS